MAGKRTSLMSLVVALLIVAVIGVFVVRELTDAGPSVQRVVLISIDTCRADHLGSYGGPAGITPNLDALAAASTVFHNATSPVPITFPAHCSMMTGLQPIRHGVRNQPGFQLTPAAITVAEVLQRSGFATGAVVSAYVLNGSLGLQQGFDTYDDQFRNPRSGGWGSERDGAETTDVAIEWLGRNKDAERMFLFAHYYDPHLPYEAPAEFSERFAPADMESPEQYAAEIAYVDHCIGRLIDELKRLGIYDETMIVVTGDHGEMLGEHGEYGHQYFIYQPAIRVPLLVKMPGQAVRRDVTDPVGLIDLAPTIWAVTPTGDTPGVDGRDISSYLLGRDTDDNSERMLYAESIVPTNYGANPVFALTGRQWKYIETTRPELYNLAADPGEADNLIDRDAEKARWLSQELWNVLSGAERDATAEARTEGTRSGLEGFGYVGVTGEITNVIDPELADPKDPVLVGIQRDYQRAVMLSARAQQAEALNICRRLIALKDDLLMVRYMLVWELPKAGEYAEALTHCNALLAVEQYAENAGEIAHRGDVHLALGNEAEALADYDRAIELSQTVGAAWLGRGQIRLARGEFDTAAADLAEAVKVLPPGDDREEAERLLDEARTSAD
ncbi:MAG: sulfatase-like hydrolase/transferase [Planctomycetota bacterium]|jgi:arylsulfatase A-like enzyme